LLIEEGVPARLQELGLASIGADSLSWLGVPMKVGDQILGILGAQSYVEPRAFGPRHRDLLVAIANQAAIALENARLFEETEIALAETEALYRASARLSAAQTHAEILSVLRAYTVLGEADRSVSLNLFDHPQAVDAASVAPEKPGALQDVGWIESVARWQAQAFADPMRYSLKEYPSATGFLQPEVPSVVSNVEEDPRLDEHTRDLYLRTFQVQSTLSVPLVVGGQWLGYVEGLFRERTEFTEVQLRRLMALAGQATVAVQGLRQLQEIRARAHREQVLRELTTRVRGSIDPEMVMRTAVRELGMALGRPAFVRLGSAEQLARRPAIAKDRKVQGGGE
jgi:GAF domain-containing protein